jgi:hypothetical protein
MKHDLNKEVISNLKDKIDALIEKGNELSEDLSVDEQYRIMKKIMHEGISKATLFICNDETAEFRKEEIEDKRKQLEQFVLEYFDRKFSEYRAIIWEKKRKL